jgi:hypothetical protein
MINRQKSFNNTGLEFNFVDHKCTSPVRVPTAIVFPSDAIVTQRTLFCVRSKIDSDRHDDSTENQRILLTRKTTDY